MNKPLVFALFLAGLMLATGAVIWLGAGKIFHAVLAIGLRGIVCVVAWQLFVFIVLGLAWRIVCPGVPLWVVIWGRLVREGGENCLPFSEVGGLVFGTRAVMLGGVGLTRAAASSIVDVIAEGFGLMPFMLLGLALLLARAPHTGLVWPMAGALAVLLAGSVACYAARAWLARLLRWGTARLLRPWTKDAPQQAWELQGDVEALFARRGRIAAASLVHFLAWCGGGGNVWIVYHLLGAPVGPLAALGIESLLSVLLGFGFLIPGALGVQELSYVALGSAFGVSPHFSLALSIIRRARDILIGAPVLGLWQGLEARQLRRGPAG
jgi:glycosyltransferase 2 family protein